MRAMGIVERNGYSTFDQTDKTSYEVPTNDADDQTGGKLSEDGATYTIEEAIEKVGFGRFQIKLSIITGLAWIADSMELMVLSILGPVLLCEWRLSAAQEAIITVVVFTGVCIASPALGWFSDHYGRRTCLMVAASWAAFYGMLSAASPLYLWLLVLRGLTGIGLGGIPQAVTYYSEFLPSKSRGKSIIFLQMAWALGSIFEVILAILILEPLGWSWWLVSSGLPLIIFVPLCLIIPESPRYLIASGRVDAAQKILENVAKNNKGKLPYGKLKAEPQIPRARLKDLFTVDHRRNTLLLWLLSFCASACYYGIVLLTTDIIQAEVICVTDDVGPLLDPNAACSAVCKTLTKDNYIQLLWTSTAELPGMILTMIYVDYMGRKTAMIINVSLFSLALCLTFICTNRSFLIMLLFAARAFASSGTQVAYVYTAELYPTVTRALGIGCLSLFGRLGVIITPFIVKVLTSTSLPSAIGVYLGVAILSIIVTILLPIETRGRNMQTGVN